jgi:hypothetical protein
MAKKNVQEAAGENETNEPRKLNMEEKRKLENLLFADIDSAVGRYEKQANQKHSELVDTLTKKPPAEVKKLFENYHLAEKQKEQIDSKLNALGYDIAYDGKLRVNIGGRAIPPQLKAFDDRTDEMRESLKSLKRDYVIKLFADHADTQSLFATLAWDLGRLIG